MIKDRIAALDWDSITTELHTQGYSLVAHLLTEDQCEELIGLYEQSEPFRKTVNMEHHRFGKGEYKYFAYPLPKIIEELRENTYPPLSLVANRWMEVLKISVSYPDSHEKLKRLCSQNQQDKATPLLLKYDKNGFNTLHQDLYGEIYFPIQAVVALSEPEVAYTGGEFVLTEQVPRAQSKVIVLNPKKGDMILFAVNFRPIKGTKGYYRAKMRHGVSEVRDGHRRTLGIIFHDARS